MKKTIKSLLVIMSLTVSFNINSVSMSILDGVTGTIDGYLINKIVFNLQMLDSFCNGINGIGYYYFDNKNWTMAKLVEAELKLRKQRDLAFSKRLNKAFIKIHSDCEIAIEFLQSYKHILKKIDKNQLLEIINDRRLSYEIVSLLASDNYLEYYNSIKTFESLNRLMQDLIKVFSEFVKNCPKAYKQFENLNSNTCKTYNAQLKKRLGSN